VRLSKGLSVFLSYSHEDKDVARALANALRSRGCRVWVDEGEMRGGDHLLERISGAIDEMDFLVALASESSIVSGWWRRELELAQTGELQRAQVKVVPVLIKGLPRSSLPGWLGGVYTLTLQGRQVDSLADKIVADLSSHLLERRKRRAGRGRAAPTGSIPNPPASYPNRYRFLLRQLGSAPWVSVGVAAWVALIVGVAVITFAPDGGAAHSSVPSAGSHASQTASPSGLGQGIGRPSGGINFGLGAALDQIVAAFLSAVWGIAIGFVGSGLERAINERRLDLAVATGIGRWAQLGAWLIAGSATSYAAFLFAGLGAAILLLATASAMLVALRAAVASKDAGRVMAAAVAPAVGTTFGAFATVAWLAIFGNPVP